MVSINPFSTVTVGSVDTRSIATQGGERIQADQLGAKGAEPAAVASVGGRDDGFLRDPDVALDLARSVASRLTSLDFGQAVDIQANSRSSDVRMLLS